MTQFESALSGDRSCRAGSGNRRATLGPRTQPPPVRTTPGRLPPSAYSSQDPVKAYLLSVLGGLAKTKRFRGLARKPTTLSSLWSSMCSSPFSSYLTAFRLTRPQARLPQQNQHTLSVNSAGPSVEEGKKRTVLCWAIMEKLGRWPYNYLQYQ